MGSSGALLSSSGPSSAGVLSLALLGFPGALLWFPVLLLLSQCSLGLFRRSASALLGYPGAQMVISGRYGVPLGLLVLSWALLGMRGALLGCYVLS